MRPVNNGVNCIPSSPTALQNGALPSNSKNTRLLSANMSRHSTRLQNGRSPSNCSLNRPILKLDSRGDWGTVVVQVLQEMDSISGAGADIQNIEAYIRKNRRIEKTGESTLRCLVKQGCKAAESTGLVMRNRTYFKVVPAVQQVKPESHSPLKSSSIVTDIAKSVGTVKRSQALCLFCNGSNSRNADGFKEHLLKCSKCGNSGHPSCLQYTPELGERLLSSGNWNCIDCKMCKICCKNKPTQGSLFICDNCDSGFHTECADNPPVRQSNQNTMWLCSDCRKIKQHCTNRRLIRSAAQNVKKRYQRQSQYVAARLRQDSEIHNDCGTSSCSEDDFEWESSNGGDSSSTFSVSNVQHGNPALRNLYDSLSAFFTPSCKRRSRVAQATRDSRLEWPPLEVQVMSPSSNNSVSVPNKRQQKKFCSSAIPFESRRQLIKQRRHRKNNIELIARGRFPILNTSSTPKCASHALNNFSLRLRRPSSISPVLHPTTSRQISATQSSVASNRLSGGASPDRKIISDNQPEAPLTQPICSPKQRRSKSTLHEREEPAVITDLDKQLYADSQRKATEKVKRSQNPVHHSSPSSKGPNVVEFGKHEITTWYSSPYPQEYVCLDRLFICEFCLKYTKTKEMLLRHMNKCSFRHPPADEIYRHHDGKLSIWEVDGLTERIYSQNLCLLAKLFLDHKTLYYDVEPFLFYVLTENDEAGAHLVGYFSKEKYSPQKHNLSCIVILPPYQSLGYGRFLISFSYLLSRRENQPGSPEKPLSELGKRSYRAYWRSSLLEALSQHVDSKKVSIRALSRYTGISAQDVVETLDRLDIFVRDFQPLRRLSIKISKPAVGEALQAVKKRLTLDADSLRWAPMASNNEQLQTPMKETAFDDTTSIKSPASVEKVNEVPLLPASVPIKKRKRLDSCSSGSKKEKEKSTVSSTQKVQKYDQEMAKPLKKRRVPSAVLDVVNNISPERREVVELTVSSGSSNKSIKKVAASKGKSIKNLKDRRKLSTVVAKAGSSSKVIRRSRRSQVAINYNEVNNEKSSDDEDVIAKSSLKPQLSVSRKRKKVNGKSRDCRSEKDRNFTRRDQSPPSSESDTEDSRRSAKRCHTKKSVDSKVSSVSATKFDAIAGTRSRNQSGKSSSTIATADKMCLEEGEDFLVKTMKASTPSFDGLDNLFSAMSPALPSESQSPVSPPVLCNSVDHLETAVRETAPPQLKRAGTDSDMDTDTEIEQLTRGHTTASAANDRPPRLSPMQPLEVSDEEKSVNSKSVRADDDDASSNGSCFTPMPNIVDGTPPPPLVEEAAAAAAAERVDAGSVPPVLENLQADVQDAIDNVVPSVSVCSDANKAVENDMVNVGASPTAAGLSSSNDEFAVSAVQPMSVITSNNTVCAAVEAPLSVTVPVSTPVCLANQLQQQQQTSLQMPLSHQSAPADISSPPSVPTPRQPSTPRQMQQQQPHTPLQQSQQQLVGSAAAVVSSSCQIASAAIVSAAQPVTVLNSPKSYSSGSGSAVSGKRQSTPIQSPRTVVNNSNAASMNLSPVTPIVHQQQQQQHKLVQQAHPVAAVSSYHNASGVNSVHLQSVQAGMGNAAFDYMSNSGYINAAQQADSRSHVVANVGNLPTAAGYASINGSLMNGIAGSGICGTNSLATTSFLPAAYHAASAVGGASGYAAATGAAMGGTGYLQPQYNQASMMNAMMSPQHAYHHMQQPAHGVNSSFSSYANSKTSASAAPPYAMWPPFYAQQPMTIPGNFTNYFAAPNAAPAMMQSFMSRNGPATNHFGAAAAGPATAVYQHHFAAQNATQIPAGHLGVGAEQFYCNSPYFQSAPQGMVMRK